MTRRLLAVALALGLLAVACGGGDEGLQVVTDDSALGTILTDSDGNTLYLFVPDAQGPSTCEGGCLEAWPAVPGDVSAGSGADDGLLGTTTRSDGSEQATYNGWPLYYFANDAAPGDVNGQGANDVWFVLDASGNAIN